MSPSISCSTALEALRRGEQLPSAFIRELGENHPDDFFRLIIEPLADSFDPAQAAAYDQLMTAWIPAALRPQPVLPARVDTVYILSRVTLGADIKITSIILDAMKRRFPDAQIVFVANRKSAELFANDPRITHLQADYPRSGPVSHRIEFAGELRRKLEGRHPIVVDPDSRMTQLGLIPLCEPQSYFHFPSRTASDALNLSDLTKNWLMRTFGASGQAYIAPHRVRLDDTLPRAAVSLGTGGNDTKRISAEFETGLVCDLATRYQTLWIDRGAGGEEAIRVTAAAEGSGTLDRIRFWEGSFAGFASIIQQSGFYAGYDSAGQHAAAACGVRLASYFNGAPSKRFEERWMPIQAMAPDVLSI